MKAQLPCLAALTVVLTACGGGTPAPAPVAPTPTPAADIRLVDIAPECRCGGKYSAYGKSALDYII